MGELAELHREGEREGGGDLCARAGGRDEAQEEEHQQRPQRVAYIGTDERRLREGLRARGELQPTHKQRQHQKYDARAVRCHGCKHARRFNTLNLNLFVQSFE